MGWPLSMSCAVSDGLCRRTAHNVGWMAGSWTFICRLALVHALSSLFAPASHFQAVYSALLRIHLSCCLRSCDSSRTQIPT